MGGNELGVGLVYLLPPSLRRCRETTDQFAAALGHASLDYNSDPVQGGCRMCSNDLVYPMRLTAWVELWTGDLVSFSGDRSAMDGVFRRSTDYGAAVVSLVTDRDNFIGHSALLYAASTSAGYRSQARELPELPSMAAVSRAVRGQQGRAG